MVWLAFLPGCTFHGSSERQTLRQIRPVNNTALLVRNAAYLKRTGRVELAVEDLEEAHLQEPENLEILDALTRSYEDLGEFDRAQELYEEALSRGGHHPALENNRCYSLYLQGRLGQAEACFRKVLARQPDNKTARNNLGLVLCRQGREAEALVMWREALSDGEARQHLGQALSALGKEVPPSLAGPPPAPAKQQVAAVGNPTATVSNPAVAPATASVRQASPPISQGMPATATSLAASPPAASAPTATQTPVTETGVSPVQPSPSSGQPPARVAAATPEPTPTATKAAPVKAASRGKKAPSAAPAVAATAKKPKNPYLTVLDLGGTRIELKNGNGVQDQARETRRRLSLEGFNVVDIGNHIDFGLEKTVIAYRPESAKVAQALAQKFFQGAKLKKEGKLSAGADIRVSLGRDYVGDQNIAAAPHKIDEGHLQAASPPAALPDYLTVQELSQVRIELKNGNGVKGQAWDIGGHLALEGFRVVNITNYKDFGLQKTVIAYRPEAARVAQALYKKFFPEANLQEEGTLPPWTDVRVSLGRDLIIDHRHLAQGYTGEAIP
jgi:Tfp pilus assembly protein PilF